MQAIMFGILAAAVAAALFALGLVILTVRSPDTIQSW